MWISANWTRFKALWQEANYRRLAIAFGFSLILHLFLIGKFSFNFPDLNTTHDFIEVRLAPPKVTSNHVKVKPSVEAKPVKKQDAFLKPLLQPKALPTENLTPFELPLPQIEQLPAPSEVIAIPVAPEVTEPLPDRSEEDSGLILNPKPYQYVETDFDVYTDKQPTLDSSVVGNAKIIYQAIPKSEKYQIKSLIKAIGLAAIFVPDLLQTSNGYVTNVGLQPMHYLYQFGVKKDKTYSADMEWESRKLTLHSEKGDQILDITEGTQDLLSFMYQFMFVPPLQNMQLSITNGRKLGIYDYSFEGEEVITTKMGNLNTVHLLRMAPEGEKRTELWLALDYQHVPVKIRETDKDGKIYELMANEIKTEMSVNSQE
jgi:hypothetical protein